MFVSESVSRSSRGPTTLLAALLVAGCAQAAGFTKVDITGWSWAGRFVGARTVAMGGAPMAIADGPGALLISASPRWPQNSVAAAHERVDYPLLPNAAGWPDADEGYTVTALALNWHGWRMGACRHERYLDNMVTQTAGDHAGAIDRKERMVLAGLGRHLLGDPMATTGTVVNLGIVYRDYGQQIAVASGNPPAAGYAVTSAGTWDLGTTMTWRPRGGGRCRQVASGIQWQNVFGRGFPSFVDDDLTLPNVLRIGIATELVLSTADPRRFGMTLAYCRVESLVKDRRDFDQFGAELELLGTISCRGGLDGQYGERAATWGAGLLLHRPEILPVVLRFDWARLSPTIEGLGKLDIDMWSVEARLPIR